MLASGDNVRIMGAFLTPNGIRAVNPSGTVVSAVPGYCKVATRYGDIELWGRDVGSVQHRQKSPTGARYRVVAYYHRDGGVSTWVAYDNVSRVAPNTHISERVYRDFETAQAEADRLRR